MKTNKLIRSFLVLATAIVGLAGCDDDLEDNNRWNYTKKDIEDVDVRPISSIDLVSGSQYTLTYTDPEYPFFNSRLSGDDFVFFDQTQLEKDSAYNTCEYVDYNMLKKYEVAYENFDNLNNGFAFEFNGLEDHHYGVLVNKDKTKRNKFFVLTNELTVADLKNGDILRKFEEKIYTTPIPGYDFTRTTFKLLANIANIFLGGNFGTSIGGFLGVLSNIFDFLKIKKSITLADVMNKLNIMDQKLENITKIINENTTRISQQLVTVQMGIDKVLFEQLNERIKDFEDKQVTPIQNYIRSLTIELQAYFKDQISNPSEISVYYGHDKDGHALAYSPFEELPQDAITLKIQPNYRKCAEYLQKTGGILGEGFQEPLYDDLYDSILAAGISFENRDKKLMAEDFLAEAVELYFYKNFHDDHTKAAEIQNLVIPFLNRIAPVGITNIVDDLTTRVSYMYNFATESSQMLQDIYAKLLMTMDYFTGLAIEICTLAKVDQHEIGDAYIAAKQHVLKAKDAVKATKPNYCYITESELTGNLQHIYTQTGFDFSKSSTGSFTHDFHVVAQKFDITKNDIVEQNYEKLREKDRPVEQPQITIMANRFKILNQMGLAGAPSFYSYLTKIKILEQGTEGAVIHHTLTPDSHGRKLNEGTLAFVGTITTRGMLDSDCNVELECDSKGYDSSHVWYFNKGSLYKYQDPNSGKGKQYWQGQAYVSHKASALDGSAIVDDLVTCCAHYFQKNAGWIRPESWGFKHDTGFYLSLHSKIS